VVNGGNATAQRIRDKMSNCQLARRALVNDIQLCNLIAQLKRPGARVPLDLADFRLQSCFLEVRFANAFRLWDRAGQIATDLQVHFPKLQLDDPAPNNQRYMLAQGMPAEVKIGLAHMGSIYPDSSLEIFKTSADVFFGTVISALDPANFERIGFRIFFEKVFDTREAAATYLQAIAPQFHRREKYFNVEGGKILDGDLFIRWEGEAVGCAVKLLTQEKTLEIVVPAEFQEVTSIEKKRRTVLVDVDYYAHAPTPTSKFKASAVIESWTKVIRRDLERFING
jgi:hypothetical protein